MKNKRFRFVLFLAVFFIATIEFLFALQAETVVTRLGEWGTGAYQRVVSNGNYAFAVAYTAGVDIIDISNVTMPRKIANIEVQGLATDVAVSGGYAYISVQDSGLLIYNVSDPSSIEPVGSYSTGSFRANRIEVSGSYAYLTTQAANMGKIDILDVSNPSAPNLVGSYNPGGRYAWFARVYGSHLFVGWGYQDNQNILHPGVRILDVATPATPIFVSDYYPGDYTTVGDLCLSGSYLYIATGASILDIVGIANINSPVRAATLTTDSNALGVRASGNYAFIACNSKGLAVANVSNPSLPYLVSSIPPANTQFLYKDLIIKGNHAFIAAWYAGLQIFDISNPVSPQWTSECNDHPNLTTNNSSFSVDLNKVYVSGNYAYVADSYSGFKSIDISNPNSPQAKAIYPPTNPPVAGNDPGTIMDFDIVGNYAYVPDSYSLQIVDISNPNAFQKIGSIGSQTKGQYIHTAIQGNYAYCTGGYVFRVIDISDPKAPLLKSAVSIGGGAYYSSIAVSGNYAYIIPELGSGVSVVDISNPMLPKIVCSVGFSGYSRGICIQGNYAYVAASDFGLHVIDISNPLSAVRVATCDTPGYALGVCISGNCAYVADHDKGLQIIDITNPSAPSIVGTYDSGAVALGVYATGNAAYLAHSAGKMSILQVSQGVYHTVAFAAGSGGGISGELTQRVLQAGSTTPVRAMPNTGYSFSAWTGTGGFNETANPLTIHNVSGDLNITAQFIATPWTISGTIKTAGGMGIEGAVLTFSNYGGGTATTDANGAYSLAVINNWSGTATPVLAGYTFSPANRTYSNVASNLPGQDYTAVVPPPPTIAVSSPNGGECWVGGLVRNITWTTTGTVENVKLEYSTDNGTNWTTIVASTSNTGTYAWTVPNAVSATCLVKVSNAANEELNDVSNAAFSIVDAATAYFTQDLYTVPPVLQKELHGVFAIDFNHDGFKDLIVLQHDFPPAPDPFVPARILAFTNNGDGTFIESTDQVLGDVRATCPNSYVVADFTGDGLDDIFIVDMGNDREPWGQGKKYILLIQKANGTLVDEASFRLPPMFNGIPYCAAAGDIDGDGSLDLVITTTGSSEYQLLVNNGQGYFQYETERLPVAKPNWIPNNCLMLDVNKDGYPDIFMGEEGAHYSQDFIFINDGTGHFTYAPDGTLPPRLLGTGSGTNGTHAADLNGDGWMDLVLSCVKDSDERIQVLFNNGDGTFSDVSDRVSSPYLNIRPAGSPCRAIADCSGDGWPELLAARNVWGGSFVPHLLINHAGLQFEDITSTVWSFHTVNGGEPPSSEFVDIDNDGDMDVIGIYPGSNQVYVLVNQNSYPISEAALPYPIAPSLTSPADGATINTNSPTLAWNSVSTALDYDIQVALSSDFSTTILGRSHWTTNSLTLKNLSYATTYYWRARARNTRGESPWSEIANFIIAPGGLSLTSPNGGESWIVGSIHNIAWISAGTIASVMVEYSTNAGSNWTIIIASTPNNGTYSWTVPAAPSATCLIRVSDASNAEISDISDAVFSIVSVPISLTLTSPNGGESWEVGSSHNITWTSTNVANVKIEYSTNSGSSYATIIASTPNSNSYAWTVPNTPSTTCLIRISDASNAAVHDVNNAVFSIVAATGLTVISPNGGEYWGRGIPQTITWSYAGDIGSKVKILLYRGTVLNKTLTIGTPTANGYFNWTVPAAMALGTTYTIRITSTTNATYTDASDEPFNIVAESLTLTAPNGGEKLIAGTTPTITWIYKGVPGTNVKLELYRGGAYDSTITLSTPIGSAGKGSFGWAIPFGQAFGKDYTVKVSSATNAGIFDASNANFMIYSGLAKSWGSDAAGELGDGSSTNSNVPVSVNSLSTVKSLSAGRNFSLALKSDGTVRAWGLNDKGQLGNSTNANSGFPVQVTGLSGITNIAAGGSFALALKSTGLISSWGENGDGQLGNAKTLDSNVPVPVFGSTKYKAVAAGDLHGAALDSDGTVRTWGSNYYGQLGIGTSGNISIKPVKVLNLTTVTALAAGMGYTAALKKDGTVWVWGDGAYGQLGNGKNAEAHKVVKVLNLTGVTAIAAGGFHMAALKTDGTVWTWGLNDKGQLGNGNNTDSNLPVQVSGLSKIVAIAAGGSHTLALESDGTVWAWGLNSSGQLGNGLNVNSNIPVQVGSLSDVVAIAAGYAHTLALK